MNKTELIAEVAKKCGISKKDAEKAVTTTFDTIADALSQGDKVQLVGFGGFETKKREARMGRNPKTKEAIEIPATTIPVFKAGKALKEKTAKQPTGPNIPKWKTSVSPRQTYMATVNNSPSNIQPSPKRKHT